MFDARAVSHYNAVTNIGMVNTNVTFDLPVRAVTRKLMIRYERRLAPNQGGCQWEKTNEVCGQTSVVMLHLSTPPAPPVPAPPLPALASPRLPGCSCHADPACSDLDLHPAQNCTMSPKDTPELAGCSAEGRLVSCIAG